MSSNILAGAAGEKMAEKYLAGKGFSIIARNYRFRRSEVDLIAREKEMLVFVEVKYRKNNAYGNPEEFVTMKKQELIQQAAENYVIENSWKGRIRFDIISITGNDDIFHLIDAF